MWYWLVCKSFFCYEIENKKLISTANAQVNAKLDVLASYKFKRAIFITKKAHEIATQLAETGQILGNKKVQYTKELKNVRIKPNKKVIDTKDNILVILGKYTPNPNSPIKGKGYPRSARGQFISFLKTRCPVITQDEYNTTTVCCLCDNRLYVAKTSHRYVKCCNCNTPNGRSVSLFLI